MRTVNIDFTGAEAPVTFFIGYKGEANNAKLTVTLPESLCSDEVDYYRAHFKTPDNNSVSSKKIYAQNGVVFLTLWYELLRTSGNLLMQLSAYDFEGNELTRLGKTPIATLRVRPSLPSGAEGNDEIHGMEAEIEELLRLHDYGNCPVIVETFLELPTSAKQGTLAFVRYPPARYVRQGVRPIIEDIGYPRLYINPYPPRPEHVYTGDDPFAEVTFVTDNGESYESSPNLYFIIFDGSDEGLPTMIQIVQKFSDGEPMYVYAWDEFYLSLEEHILPGWYKAYIDFETGDLISIEPIDLDELPVIEYAGMTRGSSVYLGYYLSPEPYFKELMNSLFVFDGTEWKPIDEEDLSIKPLETIPVRGIDFSEHNVTCSVGTTQEISRARTYPFFATNKNIEYSIGDTTLFSLSWQTDDDDRLVLYITGLVPGTTTLTATTEEGGYMKERTITIQEG